MKRFDKIFTKAFFFAEIFSRRVSSRNSNLQLDTFDVISESIENSLNFEFTFVRMICKLCKQSFNFNKKLYEHIRNHEILKLVKNFYFSINAVNLVCEIEKKSFVTHVLSVSFAKFQNSIFEFATTFKSFILLKRSIFSSITLETVLKSMKNTSMQCLIASSFSHVSQIFVQKHRYIDVQKKFVVNLHFSIDAVKLACESMKISTVNFTLSLFANLDIFNSTRFHQNLKRKRFNQIIIFIQHFEQCQHLYCESKLLEWMKVVLCDSVDIWFENQSNFIFLHDFNIVLTKTFFAISKTLVSNTKTTLQIESSKTTTCRHCDEIFNFKKSLREHKSEQHSKKRVKNFSFENNAVKLLCAIKKKSVVMNSFVSFELQASIATSKQIFESTLTLDVIISQECIHFSVHTLEIVSKSKKNKSIQCFFISSKSSFRTFESEFQEIFVQKTSNICSFLSNNTVNSASEVAKKSAITYSFSSQKSSTFSATSKNLITNTIISLQFVSSNCSSFLIATSKITTKCMKSTSILSTESAEVAKIIEKSLAEIRTQTVRIRVKLKVERAVFQLSTLETASKSMKRFSIQQIACVRICKRCKQNFNFNNKFHEHIRQHYARKSVKNSVFRVSTRESAYKIVEKSTNICSFVSHDSSISFATSRSQIFSTKMFSRLISSEDLHLTIETHKSTSKSMKRSSIQEVINARKCKLCKQNFKFNNKFHEHIREHHARKLVKDLNFRVLASESTCKVKKKSAFICSFVSHDSSTLFATSKSMFWFASIFESISSKNSCFFIATFNITSKQTEIASMLITRDFASKRVEIVAFNCSFTFSRTSLSEH